MRKFLLTIIVLLSLLFGEKAQSQIVYTDIEPDSVMSFGSGQYTFFDYDFNNDSVIDLTFIYDHFSNFRVLIRPQSNCEFTFSSYGSKIDNTSVWNSDDEFFYSTSDTSAIDSTESYLGIKLKYDENAYYGWVHLKNCNTVSSYALNTQLNDSIYAGEGMSVEADNIKAQDISDFHNGRDLKINFEKSYFDDQLSSYRILVVKSEYIAEFTIDSANLLAPANYTEVIVDGTNHEVFLNELATDVDGDVISELVSYQILIMCVGNGVDLFENFLSPASEVIVLRTYPPAVSNIIVSSEYKGATRYDVSFSFDKIPDESLISEYRVVIIKESEMNNIVFDSLGSLTEGNYLSYPPTGNNIMDVVNSDSTFDFNGVLLKHLEDYKILVGSMANGTLTNGNTFSESDSSFNMTAKLKNVYSVHAEDYENNGDPTDISISFDKMSDETGLLEYRIMAVSPENYLGFNIDSAVLVPEGNYYSVNPDGENIFVTLPLEYKDVKGNFVVNDIPYRFFVFCVADSLEKDVHTLSRASNVCAMCDPNSFKAGRKYGSNVHFVDFIPDKCVYGDYIESYFGFDMNNDEILDFGFQIFSDGYVEWPSYYGSSAKAIGPYESNSVCAITGTNNPDTLETDESIDEYNYWKNVRCNFTSSDSYSNSYAPHLDYHHYYGIWYDLTSHFIGLKVITASDTIYGWALVDVTSSEIIIKEYAYYSEPNSIPEIPNNQNLQIYPNPISTQLQAQLLINEPISEDKITIKNLTGITIKSQTINENRLLMNVEDLSPGIYFLEWNHNGVGYKRKFVVCR